jgi:hypothetical protein
MPALRSTSFFVGIITGPGPINLYTVPAGFRIVLKEIRAYNHAGTANGATIALAGGGTIVSRSLGAAGTTTSVLIVPGWTVLNAGKVIQGYSDAGKQMTYALSGSLLYI